MGDRAGRARLLAIAAALIALVVALRLLPIHELLLRFIAWIRAAGTPGMAAFVAAYVGACLFALPAVVLTLGAGFAYGVALGALLVWIGASLGAMAAFALGRTLARDAVTRRIAGNPRFAAIDRAVGRAGRRIVFLTRLSPILSFVLLNYAYGLTRVAFGDYAIATVVGMVPGIILYVYVGSLVTDVSQLAVGAPGGGLPVQILRIVGFAATVVVTVMLTRYARRALGDATADDAPPPPRPSTAPVVAPDDDANRALVAQVHPGGRMNPVPAGRYGLVVIGGGTAGLVSAAGGAGLGANVALVERHLLGGDCLNVGCVPSKALVAAARVAATVRDAKRFGVATGEVAIDFAAVMDRMRRLRAGIAPHDGVPRLASLGVDVYLGDARFTSPTTVQVDGRRLEFARAVIATGGRPTAPPIPGLADVGYLTNETVFSLTELPRRLVVIGGGPIGCELAQAFRAFGAAVTMLHADDHVLPREDPEAAAILAARLAADGVVVVDRASITRVARHDGDILVSYEAGGRAATVAADRLLVAAGRSPTVEGLGLEAAGVAYDRHGVAVDDRLRTSNRRVYAAGDVCGGLQFTHLADAHARIVLANALFLGRQRASTLTVPWCTYTTPEVAHVGLTATDAEAHGVAISTLAVPLHDVDRAVLEGDDAGFLKLLLRRGSDRVVGATLVATHAGEIVSEISVAMATGMGLQRLATVIHPYPTTAEVVRKAADAWNRTRLTPRVKRIFAWWLALRQ